MSAALALAGCGGGGEVAKKELNSTESASAPAAGTAVPDEANGGAITGKVAFAGSKPAVKMLDMSATPFCTRAHPNGAASEEVVINGNGTLKNAFVWVKSGLKETGWKTRTEPAVLDQVGCMYKPHVLAVMAGQPVAMKNSDGTNHNIHPTPSANREWNESQPPGSADRQQAFPRPETMIPVKCNIHPWMRAYINVVSHPFFAVTGDDGSFTIKGLPPGTYTIEVVHEKYGKQEQQVTVGAKESKTADFTIRG